MELTRENAMEKMTSVGEVMAWGAYAALNQARKLTQGAVTLEAVMEKLRQVKTALDTASRELAALLEEVV